MVLYEIFTVTIGENTNHLTVNIRIIILYPKREDV